LRLSKDAAEVRRELTAPEVDVDDVGLVSAAPDLKAFGGEAHVEPHVVGHRNGRGAALGHVVGAAATDDGLFDTPQELGEFHVAFMGTSARANTPESSFRGNSMRRCAIRV
jgi:hypothetical protein